MNFIPLTAHIIPGLLLLSLTYVGDNAYACVALITISLGSNGSATLTNLQNSQDLAPNFAGSCYSIINFIAFSSGFISPLVVGYFTQEQVNILVFQVFIDSVSEIFCLLYLSSEYIQ